MNNQTDPRHTVESLTVQVRRRAVRDEIWPVMARPERNESQTLRDAAVRRLDAATDRIMRLTARPDREARAEARGAEQALREAADEVDLSASFYPSPTGQVSGTCRLAESATRDMLIARADRIATAIREA